ncbi:hypothetical protein [Pectinatus sottacetonis]|uniref:hypothetical protein n=1 Tax=Pectinatus sottacetonis TaxID=1002795 RepID=UPI0038B2EBD7
MLSTRDDNIFVSNSAVIASNLYNASCKILIMEGELRKKVYHILVYRHIALLGN